MIQEKQLRLGAPPLMKGGDQLQKAAFSLKIGPRRTKRTDSLGGDAALCIGALG